MKPSDEDNLKTVRGYYNHGEGVISYRRYKKALQKLVRNNNPEGLTIESSLQRPNVSDEEHDKRRIMLLEQAMDLNFAPAMFIRAEIYYSDDGDKKKAFHLYEKAAELGNSDSLRILSVCYKLGIDGFQKNIAKSEELNKKIEEGFYWCEFKGFTKHDVYE